MHKAEKRRSNVKKYKLSSDFYDKEFFNFDLDRKIDVMNSTRRSNYHNEKPKEKLVNFRDRYYKERKKLHNSCIRSKTFMTGKNTYRSRYG